MTAETLRRCARQATRTYYAWAVRAPSRRALWDTTVTELLAGCYEPDKHGERRPEALYGALKMWAYLNRERVDVARCTVERLNKGQRLAGCDEDQDGTHDGP